MRHWLWFRIVTAILLASALSVAQEGSSKEADSTQSASKSDAATPQPMRLSQAVANSLLIKKKPPKYLSDARKARIQGPVVVQPVVDTSGSVKDLKLVSGHPMLAPAALKAVKKWKFRPYLLNGQPVEFETQLVVSFALSQ